MRMFLRGDSFKDSSCPDCCGCIVITKESLEILIDSYNLDGNAEGEFIFLDFPGFKELKRKE